MNEIQFYQTHSELTDPGKFDFLFEELSPDYFCLHQMIHNVIIHFGDAKSLGFFIPQQRYPETELRHLNKMLEQIYKLQPTALNINRVPERRLIGCCRDFALFVCSILRHNHIPARLRYGFTTYQFPRFHHDQAIVEYWNQSEKKWCIVDPRVNSIFINNFKLKIDFNLNDLPRNKFLTAGEAWHLCRNGQKNSNQFGAGLVKRLTGLGYIRNKLLQDFASLNKIELLMWDCWGYMLKSKSNEILDEKQLKLFDYLADLTRHDVYLDECQDIFKNDINLQVPNVILSANPFYDVGRIFLEL